MATVKFKFGKTITYREYGEGKKISKIGVMVDGNDMSTASIFGDKADWLNELHEKHGGTIEATVYDADALRNAEVAPGTYAAAFNQKYSEWSIKMPRGTNEGAGYRKQYGGGGGWKPGGSTGGGWKPEYRGKPMPEHLYVEFCEKTITSVGKALKKAFKDASDDKILEVSQSTFATILIGMQKGMSFPAGYEPDVAAPASGSDTTATPTVDKSNPDVMAYVTQIDEAGDQATCQLIAHEVNSDGKLSEQQKIALKALALTRQKELA